MPVFKVMFIRHHNDKHPDQTSILEAENAREALAMAFQNGIRNDCGEELCLQSLIDAVQHLDNYHRQTTVEVANPQDPDNPFKYLLWQYAGANIGYGRTDNGMVSGMIRSKNVWVTVEERRLPEGWKPSKNRQTALMGKSKEELANMIMWMEAAS